jgi:hypothetical protein
MKEIFFGVRIFDRSSIVENFATMKLGGWRAKMTRPVWRALA